MIMGPTAAAETTSATYGAMSSVMCDYVYIPAANAQFYTSPCIVASTTTPFEVLITITACRQPITLQTGDSIATGSAMISPVRERSMRAEAVKAVILKLDPLHPAYRLFRNLDSIQQLDRNSFAEFDQALDDAYHGRLTLIGSQLLYHGVLEKVLTVLPDLPPLDTRVQKVMHLLHDNPRLPVNELAVQNDLSYDRMSHLFADELGISIRSFQVWVKLQRALSGIRYGQSLVELARRSGFSDAAHLSRVYKQAYGAPPSYFYYSGNVKLAASYLGDIPGAPTMADPELMQRA